MPATSIYFNGRFTRVPGSYSEISASALDAVGLTASGYVAVIGTAIGGKPYSAIDNDDVAGTIEKSSRPGKAAGFFEAGSDLLEAEGLLFNPSNDNDIEGGAQRVYWIKVNVSTQSTLTVVNLDGNVMTMTSEKYGWATTRLNYEKGNGTNQGHMITLTQDATQEVLDDIGGDAIFTLTFAATTPAQGYTTLTATASSTVLAAIFTRTMAGLDLEMDGILIVTGYGDSALPEVSIVNPADAGLDVTIYGVDETGAAISETVTTSAAAPVATTDAFNEVHGARIASAPAGNVLVTNPSGGATIATLTAVNQTRGLYQLSDFWAGYAITTWVANGATGRKVSFFGVSATDAATDDVVTLNGITPVPGTVSFKRLDWVAAGMVTAGITMTVSGTSLSCAYASYDTVSTQLVRWNAHTGYTFAQGTGQSNFEMDTLDIVTSATNILSAAIGSFYADLQAILDAINNQSGLATVVKVTNATGPPSNTTAPLFFAGGHEGDSTPGSEATPYATAANWQAAIDVLKKLFVNTLVPLTADAAVHAMIKAHCAYMCGAGRMERDGIVGVMNGTALATKSQIKSQAVALNTRHVRAVAQQCERYNAALVKTKMAPYYTACLAAGMQAGSSVGTSLTYKFTNTLGIYGNSGWHPVDDADEMIEMGLLFMETIDGVGFRWVRNVTTYLIDSNLAYVEGSVNEATNYAAYNFRTQMESQVGAKGFSGTIQAAESVARQTLTLLMDDALTAWRSLAIELTLDVMEVDVEISPVIPVNFIQSTVHLVSTPLSASS